MDADSSKVLELHCAYCHYSLGMKGQSPLDKWRADSGESDV